MEYLRQNSQMLHNGEVIATDSQKVREEIEVALKKDSRREGRRLKRQAAKKNGQWSVCILIQLHGQFNLQSFKSLRLRCFCSLSPSLLSYKILV